MTYSRYLIEVPTKYSNRLEVDLSTFECGSSIEFCWSNSENTTFRSYLTDEEITLLKLAYQEIIFYID